MLNTPMPERTSIAALIYAAGTDPAPALAEVARILHARGVAIAGVLPAPWDTVVVAVWALLVFPFAVRSGVREGTHPDASPVAVDTQPG